MKIKLPQSLVVIAFFCLFFSGNTSKAQMIFSLTPTSNTICAGTSGSPVTNIISSVLAGTVSGANYYTCIFSSGISISNISWTGSVSALGSTINITTWCTAPGVYTMTSLAYASNSSSVVLASTTQTLLAIAGPTISVSGPSTVCPFSINNYTANGASSYTWFAFTGSGSYSISGSAIASMTAGTIATFSVRGTAANGCVNANVFSPSIGSTSVTVSNNTVCAGSSATLSASGALSYTWSNGLNFPTIVVSPSATTVYTLTSSNSGCTSTSTHVIAVTSAPNLTISPSQNVCSSSNISITAMGANTYTWLPGMITSGILFINASTSTCYTVIGSNGGNCTSTAVSCVSVMPSPTVTVISSGSVCSGSSVSFTASGANTYTWNTGAIGSTIVTTPATGGNIQVIGSNTLNGCTHSATLAMIVSPSCAIVWPGDANRDGLVSTLDVLELGLAAGSTGAARSSTSNAWSAQFANAWTSTLSTGWNKVHADCNGDGVVNTNDNAAITANFALTHGFKNNKVSSNPDISLVPQQTFATEGIWNKVDVVLGSTSNSISQLYGLAFDINYDESKIQTDSVKLIYTSSFLNANNQNIDFSKTNFNNGKLYCASVRVDHTNKTGNGKIAEFWFKVKTGLGNNASINVSTSTTQKVSDIGIFTTMTNDAGLTINISNATGLNETLELNSHFNLYPNPAKEKIVLISDLNTKTTYRVIDLTGRLILSGEFTSNKTLDISSINKGVYFIEFETAQGKSQKKLVKE